MAVYKGGGGGFPIPPIVVKLTSLALTFVVGHVHDMAGRLHRSTTPLVYFTDLYCCSILPPNGFFWFDAEIGTMITMSRMAYMATTFHISKG